MSKYPNFGRMASLEIISFYWIIFLLPNKFLNAKSVSNPDPELLPTTSNSPPELPLMIIAYSYGPVLAEALPVWVGGDGV